MLARFVVAVALAAATTEVSQAVEISAIVDALAAPIVEPAVVQKDVEDFCLRRVPEMPHPATVAEWEAFAKQARQSTLDKVVFRGAAAEWRQQATQPEWLGELHGEGYRIRKLRFEAVPGMWVPALLYEPSQMSGRVPVVLNVNGHDPDGKAAGYKQIRCINQAKRGMLALNIEWLNMGQLKSPDFEHYKMNQLDLCGTSGVACFYLSMSRGLDILLAHENADPQRVAVTGLSGGGWQTIFISALDERVTLCDPVAGYSGFRTRALFHSDLGDSEQTPTDLATTADYAVLTAMRAPRPTLLTFNDRDTCCFRSDHALPPLLEAARPIFALYDAGDNLSAHVNHLPGTHNFEQDNREALYRMIGKHFYAESEFDWHEIACEKEIRTAEELNVDLPPGNAGFQTIATRMAAGLPHPSKDDVETRRKKLSELLRYEPQAVGEAALIGSVSHDGCDIHHWRLRIADRWTLPATEFIPEGAVRSTILMADEGRVSTSATIASLLAQKVRVLAVDAYNTGESKIPSHDFLFGLLIAAVGERPLGVLSAQINATADWWSTQTGGPVDVITIGKRTSLGALCAAAVNGTSLSHIDLRNGLASLKQVMEQGLSIPDGPEFFCFGLLEEFDVGDLRSLAGETRQP